MDLLEKFAPKKKNPSINQCGEKGGGYYIPVGLKISEPLVPGKKKKKKPWY
jgi:hypothetical protein